MPIIGIPIIGEDVIPSLLTKVSLTPELFGEQVLTRRPGIRTFAGNNNRIQIAVIDEQDHIVTFTESTNIRCRFAEAILFETSLGENTPVEIDYDRGIVSFEVPENVRNNAGVYIASVGIFDSSNRLLLTRDVWIYNESSVWVSNVNGCALPRIDEIRLQLRDSSVIENELLGSYQFGIEEIAQAAVDTVRLWNTLPPPVENRTTQNFRWYDIWKTGIHYYLFEIFIEWLRKNKLAYNAGGVSVDDMSVKIQDYMVASQQKYQQLVTLMKQTKIMYNIAAGFGKIG